MEKTRYPVNELAAFLRDGGVRSPAGGAP